MSSDAFAKWIMNSGKIGSWTLDHKIAQGGMGIVFLGKKTNIHGQEDRAAIKIMTPETFQDPQARQLFKHEFDVLSRISTPYIPSVVDSGIAPYKSGKDSFDLLWFAMEEIKGGSLDDELRKHGKLSTEEWDRLAHDLFSAIAEAHENGIIHKDIKPANIGRFSRRSVLLDFGGASYVNIDDPGDIGVMTLPYAAPEQHDFSTRPEDLSFEVDLFAAGVTLVEAATGRLPWKMPSTATVNEFAKANPQLVKAIPAKRLVLAFVLQQKTTVAPDLTGMTAEQVDLVRPLLSSTPGKRGSAQNVLSKLQKPASVKPGKALKAAAADSPSERERVVTERPVKVRPEKERQLRKLTTVWALAVFAGFFGIDRFYTGKIGTGLLKMFTIGGYGIWAFIDAFALGSGQAKDKWGRDFVGSDEDVALVAKWRVIAAAVAAALCIVVVVWSQLNRSTNG